MQEMSETDPGPLSTSKMDFAVIIIDDSPIYAESPVLARTLLRLSSVKLPVLAMILLSLLY